MHEYVSDAIRILFNTHTRARRNDFESKEGGGGGGGGGGHWRIVGTSGILFFLNG